MPITLAMDQEATLVATFVPLTLKITSFLLGRGTLVKKVIVTNVLEPTLSLNIDTTNVLSQSRCLLHLFSLQAKLSLMKRITASNSRFRGPYPRLEEPTRRAEE